MTDKRCPDCNSIQTAYERETQTLELRKCRDCGKRFAIDKVN